MADVSRSGDVTSDGNGAEERLLSAIGSLRPGPTEGEKAVIAEYAYIKEQLAGPQFLPSLDRCVMPELPDAGCCSVCCPNWAPRGIRDPEPFARQRRNTLDTG
jgi:hypothetical protein